MIKGVSFISILQTIIIGASKRSGALRQVRMRDDSRSFTFQWCSFDTSVFVRITGGII